MGRRIYDGTSEHGGNLPYYFRIVGFVYLWLCLMLAVEYNVSHLVCYSVIYHMTSLLSSE